MALSRGLLPLAHDYSPTVIGIVKKVEFQTNLLSEMKIKVCSKKGKLLNGAPHNAIQERNIEICIPRGVERQSDSELCTSEQYDNTSFYPIFSN
jgi:hypothetical protein